MDGAEQFVEFNAHIFKTSKKFHDYYLSSMEHGFIMI